MTTVSTTTSTTGTTGSSGSSQSSLPSGGGGGGGVGVIGALSDAITSELGRIVMWASIIAGVFFLFTILLIFAIFVKRKKPCPLYGQPFSKVGPGTFATVVMTFSAVIFAVLGAVAAIVAGYVDGVSRNVENAMSKFSRGAAFAVLGGKLLNGIVGKIVGKNVIDETTGEPCLTSATGSCASSGAETVAATAAGAGSGTALGSAIAAGSGSRNAAPLIAPPNLTAVVP